MTYKGTSQFAVTQLMSSLWTEIAQAGWIIRSVFNKQSYGCHCCSGLLHISCSIPLQKCYLCRPTSTDQYVLLLHWTKTPTAPRHITSGHWENRSEALLYVYPIISFAMTTKLGFRTVSSPIFPWGLAGIRLCGLGLNSVMELRCAAWLVSHEGGSSSDWREGGDLW